MSGYMYHVDLETLEEAISNSYGNDYSIDEYHNDDSSEFDQIIDVEAEFDCSWEDETYSHIDMV